MTRQIDSDAVIDAVRLKEQGSAPATPAVGYGKLYTTAAGLKYVDDNGVVFGPLSTGQTPGGRLTLTTATPVTTADVTAAATLYYTPYHSDIITLYDGERWIPVIFTEKSLSLAALTASKPYDIWGYISSGTLALEALVWTDGTTRATALAYQDGRLVKSGAATRRYLGSIYINSSGGQTDDSITKRFVWNYYNRVPTNMLKQDATAHNYTTAALRQWNNDAANKVECIIGVLEYPHDISIIGSITPSADGVAGSVAVGFDATNANHLATAVASLSIGGNAVIGISYKKLPAVGYHYYAALEYGATTVNFANFTMSIGCMK